MDSLPPELILNIVRQLPCWDLPSARAVCRSTGSFATPLLFRKIQVSLSRKDLTRLQNIALARNVSHYVEDVILETRSLREYDLSSFHAARKYRSHRCTWNIEGHGFSCQSTKVSMQELALYWKYQDAFEDQRDVERSGTDHKLLLEAFNLLKNLRAVSTNDLDAHNELTGDCDDYREFMYSKDAYGLPLTWSCEHLLPTLMRALSGSNAKLHSLKLGTYGVYEASLYARLFPKAVCEAFDQRSEYDWPGSLRNLRDIELRGLDWDDDDHVSDAAISTFRNLMQSTPSLERLAIQSLSTNDVPLPELLGTHTFRNLRHLYLSFFYFTADDLIGFLCRHASTLETVTLDFIHLTGRTRRDMWSSLLEELRSFGFPRLESFILDLCPNRDGIFFECCAVEKYIGCEIDVNPCLEDEEETNSEAEDGL